ncbi:pentapeptide repeat-containing protein [Amycolatopsis sp. NPDC057786]|uniref:pentapeptide repeat-containing protein n=1 Tax=Amycolatopsis sp. NPDC057786 TaxID=3346250 RepID=UPI003670D1FD
MNPWGDCQIDECAAIRFGDFDRCLAHLEPGDLDAALAGLKPGDDVDLRATVLSKELVGRLLRAVRNTDARPSFGRADFTLARFPDKRTDFNDAVFASVTFNDVIFSDHLNFEGVDFGQFCSFVGAQFSANTSFVQSRFGELLVRHAKFGPVQFRDVVFEGPALFTEETEFAGPANFAGATFAGPVEFQRTRFASGAWFTEARFHTDPGFDTVRFEGDSSFAGAEFERTERIGPLLARDLSFSRAVFQKRVIVEAVATTLNCAEATFREGSTLALRGGEIDLERAVFGKPSTVSAADRPFFVDEPSAAMLKPSLLSIRGVDVADLVLTDIDLAGCLFAGAHHLDKLRIEGDCESGTLRRRQALAEERAWRADRTAPVGPRRIVDLYRQLRKAQEDSKNEPGAADFYYGEMEMRRHSPATPWSERVILHLYWLVSGYGLRALRALATLAVLIALVTVGFWLGGFKTTPAFGDTLIYVAQSTVSLETKLASLPKDLTPLGEVLRLVTRVLGPLLLGLTLLAVRNRVKR